MDGEERLGDRKKECIEGEEPGLEAREMSHRVRSLRLRRQAGGDRDQGQRDQEKGNLLEQDAGAPYTLLVPLEPEPIQQEEDDRNHGGDQLGETCQENESERQDVREPRSAPAPPGRIAHVRKERGQEEERAEEVLAVGDPGNRFGSQGMDREERGGNPHPERGGDLVGYVLASLLRRSPPAGA